MGFEITLLFAFFAMACWGFGDFFIQRVTRKIGDIETLAFIGIIGTIVLLPFALKDINLLFNQSNLILLLVLGVITFFIAVIDFEALKKGKLSIVEVIVEIELPITIILSYIFFKEMLSFFQFFCVALIFIGIVLIATKSFAHWKAKLEKGVILAVITAFGMGVINFLTAKSSKEISPVMAIWIPWIVYTILCLILISKRSDIKQFFSNGLKYKKLVLTMGICDTLAWVFFALALLKNPVSITTAITESYPALAMALGVLLNKEKINWHQYLGGALAITASVLLALFV